MYGHLLVRVVEVDGEAGWEDGLRRGCDAAILSDGFGGQTGLGPFGDNQDLAEENVGDIRVIKSGGVAVVRRGRGGIRIAEGVGGFRFVSVLAEIDRPKLGLLVVFEVEGYWS